MNLRQGKMTMKEYALKFYQLHHYTLELVSSMRAKMRKFAISLSQDLVL